MGVNAAPTSTQNLAYRGQGLTGSAVNPQYLPSQQNPTMRPTQSMPAGSAPGPQQFMPAIKSTHCFRVRFEDGYVNQQGRFRISPYHNIQQKAHILQQQI
jgi:hypothetical protein